MANDSPAAVLVNSSGTEIGTAATPLRNQGTAPLPNGTPVTGSISALGGTVQAAAEGYESVSFVLTGTWSATLVAELSHDGGSTWATTGINGASPFGVQPAIFNYVTANGTYQVAGNSACTHVRLRAAAYVSGPVSVRLVLGTNQQFWPLVHSMIRQDVAASTLNGSIANLAAGAVFTGTGESTLGVSGIQVQFKSDQPCLVQMQQSLDNDPAHWDLVDETLVPGGDVRGRTFQAVGNYFRVVVTNVGNATTTFLRLGVALCPTVEALPRALTTQGRLSLATARTSWFPSDHNHPVHSAVRPDIWLDADYRLETRGGVLTDCASFRDDFGGSALYTDLTGTCYFTNGGLYVTGIGTSFLTEVRTSMKLKLSSHADSVYVKVAEVRSDTLLILTAAYMGATGNGTGRGSNWLPSIGTGGSIAVASSEVALASGTTNGTTVQLRRLGDYLPIIASARLRLTQRIANQEAVMGVAESEVSPHCQALAVFDGTDNTKVKLRTSSNNSDLEETTVTLPGGLTSATAAYYSLEITARSVALLVNDIKLAEHKLHIPDPYAPMDTYLRIKNTAVVTTTTLYADVWMFNNFDRVETVASPKADPLTVAPVSGNQAAVTSVAAAVADTSLLVSSALRRGATVFNDSTALCYLKLGTGASLTSFTVILARNGYYEVPFAYIGAVNGYWTAATGSARVTELT